jgi:hypothetical protein
MVSSPGNATPALINCLWKRELEDEQRSLSQFSHYEIVIANGSFVMKTIVSERLLCLDRLSIYLKSLLCSGGFWRLLAATFGFMWEHKQGVV